MRSSVVSWHSNDQMKRILLITILLLGFCLTPSAQQRKRTGKRPTATAVQQKKKPAQKKKVKKQN